MKNLWTFDNQEKLELFKAILVDHEIEFEVLSQGRPGKGGEFTVAVAEGEYAKAKRLLLKHRKRRKSSDLS